MSDSSCRILEASGVLRLRLMLRTQAAQNPGAVMKGGQGENGHAARASQSFGAWALVSRAWVHLGAKKYVK